MTTAMPFSTVDHAAVSRPSIWTGRILTALAGAFMLMDAMMKLFKPAFVVDATLRLGYAESTIVPIGVALLICTILHLIPRTSVWGALFLTGYLGGAVASNVRAGQGSFNIIFPVIFAVIVWAGLWLRNPAVRLLLSPRNSIK